MRKINTLVGHSGCDIKLVSENSILFVRKTSSDIKYNKRPSKNSYVLAPSYKIPQETR